MANMDIPGKVVARRIALLSGVMLVYWILLFTEPFHHLIRTRVWLEPIGAFERVGMSRTLPRLFVLCLDNVLVLWAWVFVCSSITEE